ncbi:hypothetical protein PINS_up015466 [Pythium insidiosum]|nr:hypothetical protein PINS_up015466 [Pythium insidiosum]
MVESQQCFSLDFEELGEQLGLSDTEMLARLRTPPRLCVTDCSPANSAPFSAIVLLSADASAEQMKGLKQCLNTCQAVVAVVIGPEKSSFLCQHRPFGPPVLVATDTSDAIVQGCQYLRRLSAHDASSVLVVDTDAGIDVHRITSLMERAQTSSNEIQVLSLVEQSENNQSPMGLWALNQDVVDRLLSAAELTKRQQHSHEAPESIQHDEIAQWLKEWVGDDRYQDICWDATQQQRIETPECASFTEENPSEDRTSSVTEATSLLPKRGSYVAPPQNHACSVQVNSNDDLVNSSSAFVFQLQDSAAPIALQWTTHSSVDPRDDDTGTALRARRSSVLRPRLPSSVTDVRLEAVVEASKPSARRLSVLLTVQRQVPLIGYVILLSALCAVSSQGAVLDLLVGVPPLLKLFWRMSGASLAFLPLAILSVYQHNGLRRLSWRRWGLFLLCAVSYAVFNATFLIALSRTSIGHVYIFSNCHSLLMVLSKLVLREPIGAQELLGAALGFSGGVVTTLDHGEQSDATDAAAPHASTSGDLIAFLGAFAGMSYLLLAKRVRAVLGVRVFLFLLVTTVAVLLLPVLLVQRAALGIDLGDLTHPRTGLFGWVHHLSIELYVVLVGSMAGTMGFVTSLRYFDPLVVSVTMLTEPVVATVVGIAVGVDRVPGLPTVVGGLAVIAGCALVLRAARQSSVQVDVSDRLVPASQQQQQRLRASPSSIHDARRHSLVVPPRALTRPTELHYGSFP